MKTVKVIFITCFLAFAMSACNPNPKKPLSEVEYTEGVLPDSSKFTSVMIYEKDNAVIIADKIGIREIQVYNKWGMLDAMLTTLVLGMIIGAFIVALNTN